MDIEDRVEEVWSFRVVTTRDGDVSHLVVVGEVDSGSAAELTAAFDAELVAGAMRIRLDLSQTSFVDSSGLVVLLDLRAAVASHEAHLTLVQPSPAVRRVLEVAELASVFDVEP